MSKPSKYVVILELDSGYMECVAICDKPNEAYGEAYLALIDEMDEDSYYVTLAEPREGDNGYILELVDKATHKVKQWVTVLFYRSETDDNKGRG